MCGPWLTVLIVDHHISITMISDDHHLATDLLDGIDNLSDCMIHHLDGLHSRWNHTGMADHIRVCEVCDDHIVLL